MEASDRHRIAALTPVNDRHASGTEHYPPAAGNDCQAFVQSKAVGHADWAWPLPGFGGGRP
jgi:hypothetical protein